MADHVERDVICYGWLTSDARLILFMSGLVGDCVLEVSTQCKALSKFMQTTKLRKDLISSSNQALPSLQRYGSNWLGQSRISYELNKRSPTFILEHSTQNTYLHS